MHNCKWVCVSMGIALSSWPISALALNVVNYSDATNQFMFIENQEDSDYFVTPVNVLDPRLTGGSAWTSLKNTRQRSLAYVDPGNNFVAGGYYIDMWEENSPIPYPYTTHRCIDSVDNCNMDTGTSIFGPPPLVDSKGFYGIRAAYGWSHAEISSSFFSYIRNMNVGETLSRTMHYCRTTAIYDPTKGERCSEQTTGNWASRTVHQTKESHLILKRTNAVTHLMVDSAGNPIILPGSTGCEEATVSGRKGAVCEFLDFDLQTMGGSYSNIGIDTTLMKGLSLASNYDLQKSANKASWVTHGSYLRLTNLVGNNKIYLFMSNNLLTRLITLNNGDISARDYFKFLFYNSLAPESGYYELSGTTEINIHPREFLVTINSSDGTSNPYRRGNIGSDILNFNYDIVASAPITSSSLDISVSQDIPGTWNNGYCLFYPDNSKSVDQAVPVPAYISFRQASGSIYRELIHCDNGTISLQDNNIIESQPSVETPLPDNSGDVIYTTFYNLDLDFDLTDTISERTTSDSFWEGEVHQSGTITVKATWNE